MSKEKVLVTGAAGFIGAAVAAEMQSLGYDVYTVDNLSTGYESHVPEGVVFLKGDVQDEKVIAQLKFIPFKAIFHIAGQSSGEISFDNPVYDLQTNTQSTLLLLKLAMEIGCRKFIYASTMSVYGDQSDEPVGEDIPVNPKSFYAVGKLASENYLKIYSCYGINCIALRLFNVYGPGQNMKNLRQGMVSIFLSQAIDDKKINVRGSLDRYRDMVYIDDIVSSFIKAFQTQLKGYHFYNVSTGEKTTVRNVLDSIAKGLSYEVQVEVKDDTPGDIFGIYGAKEKIINELGWKPQIDFETGLSRMIKWATGSDKN
jgi:UDP-glucose 4-epimerase